MVPKSEVVEAGDAKCFIRVLTRRDAAGVAEFLQLSPQPFPLGLLLLLLLLFLLNLPRCQPPLNDALVADDIRNQLLGILRTEWRRTGQQKSARA